MDKAALLSQLKDIHNPAAISMFPDTVAWYALFALFISGCLWFGINYFKNAQKRRRRKQALHALDLVIVSHQDNPTTAVAQISILLRRIALAKYPRKEVAHLSGTAWLTFLDRQLQSTDFSQGVGKLLITAPYQKHVDIQLKLLATLVERWIKRVL